MGTLSLNGQCVSVDWRPRANGLVNCDVDHWLAIKCHVPGVEAAVLDAVQNCNGCPLTSCKGEECDDNGYREGTRFLHFYGISPKSPQVIFDLIEKMALPYLKEIHGTRTSIEKSLADVIH